MLLLDITKSTSVRLDCQPPSTHTTSRLQVVQGPYSSHLRSGEDKTQLRPRTANRTSINNIAKLQSIQKRPHQICVKHQVLGIRSSGPQKPALAPDSSHFKLWKQQHWHLSLYSFTDSELHTSLSSNIRYDDAASSEELNWNGTLQFQLYTKHTVNHYAKHQPAQNVLKLSCNSLLPNNSIPFRVEIFELRLRPTRLHVTKHIAI